MPGMRFSALVAGVAAFCAVAQGTTVKELVRIKGQGESVLQGYGLVTGLAGTGDSGKELAMSRPLSKVLEMPGTCLARPRIWRTASRWRAGNRDVRGAGGGRAGR